MGKNKIISYKHVTKDSFSRLFDEWCKNGGDEKIRTSNNAKEKQFEIKEDMTISSLRLMRVEASLDLHGLIGSEAYREAVSFLKEQFESGKRKVEIIVGKGLHSKDGKAVVKENVIMAINSLTFIREYYSPQERYGGMGTFHIIFKT